MDADWEYTAIFFVVGFIGSAFFVGARRKTDGAMASIGAAALTVVYLGLLPQFIVRLRVFGPGEATWLLLYYLATVKACDIGAYFTGRAIGRTKLIEWLSPKKTIEGLCGGVAASVLVAVGVPALAGWLGDGAPSYLPTLPMAAAFGAAMALLGQAGDLLESLFKRDAQVKDSASAIPAFGGVLDMIDSPLLTAPAAYWMLTQ